MSLKKLLFAPDCNKATNV